MLHHGVTKYSDSGLQDAPPPTHNPQTNIFSTDLSSSSVNQAYLDDRRCEIYTIHLKVDKSYHQLLMSVPNCTQYP